MTAQIKNLIKNDVRGGDDVDLVCLRYGVTKKQIAKVIPIGNGIRKKPSEAPVMRKVQKEPTKKVKNPVMVEAGKKAWITIRKNRLMKANEARL